MIFYDWKNDLTYKDCHARLVQAWGSNAPSHHTLFHCFREFQRNKFSVQHVPRSTGPSTSLTEQTIDARRKIIENDLHPTYQQIEAILSINSTAINSSLLKCKKSLWWMGAADTNRSPKTTPTSILPSFSKEI